MKLTIELDNKYLHIEIGDLDDDADDTVSVEESERIMTLPFGFTAVATDDEEEDDDGETPEVTVRKGSRRG